MDARVREAEAHRDIGGPPAAAFSGRLGHTLAIALGIVLLVVMAVGGTSLFLAVRVYQNVNASAAEFGRILKLDQVHSVFDDLIFELQQIDATRRSGHTSDALLMQEEIARQLNVLGETIERDTGAADRPRLILDELHRLSDQGRAVTMRLSASGRLSSSDLDWLNRATHEVPRLTDELAGLHEFRITRLHEDSERRMQAIVALYAAFTLVGAALVALAAHVANRGIAFPLRTLAKAAEGIAEGRLDTRVSVRTGNEIGFLAQTFNAMAERLQQHERQMRTAQDALAHKVREARALYQIGVEIARLQHLDRILQAVVDKARELLCADAVAVQLAPASDGHTVPPARSGPPQAFENGDHPPPAAAAGGGEGRHRVLTPAYARGYIAGPIRLRGAQLGTIHVGTRAERTFTADDSDLLAGLALQAANAIERVRLSEQLRSLAVVQERERLAREMHDGLAQELGLLHLKLNGALERSADGPAADAMREMVRITDHAYEEVRQSIYGLRTFVSRGLGLVPTLTEFLHDFSVENGIAVELDVDDRMSARLPPAAELQLVRIIQEALSNVRKHAHVDQAWVRLRKQGDWIRVAVEDHGVGWDPSKAANRLHFGLQGMRERAEALGGRLQVDTVPGRGTRVVAMVPGGGEP